MQIFYDIPEWVEQLVTFERANDILIKWILEETDESLIQLYFTAMHENHQKYCDILENEDKESNHSRNVIQYMLDVERDSPEHEKIFLKKYCPSQLDGILATNQNA